MTDTEPSERPTAEPITAVLADRVRRFRERAGMSQADLARRMNELGTPWTRATVINLEKRGRTSRKRTATAGRDSVTVQELLRLALALDVPPDWLLVDPEGDTPVPLADGVEVDSWTALAWLSGLNPLEESSDGAGVAYRAIYQLHTLVRLLGQYRILRRMLDAPPGSLPIEGNESTEGALLDARHSVEATAATLLRSIADRLGQFDALQLSVPQMPADVRKHATELGVDLPGQGG